MSLDLNFRLNLFKMELAMAKIIEITPAQFKQLSAQENVLLCDIR